ncbi:glutamate receptor-like [Periplaneta americana]|uniref:glutamate receptor-like n=1 Tax=Periplaneta americana TaxID=6978 RepID=UPI0037E70A7E
MRELAGYSISSSVALNDSSVVSKRPLQVLLSPCNSLLRKMTLTTRMQDAIWLLHLEEQSSLEEALRGVYIPLDCLFFVAQNRGEEVVLTDVYSLTSKLAVSHFGTWSLGGGLRIASFSFYSRISDLRGSVVTATTVHGPPMTAINKDTQQISGFLGEVWKELEYRMNFTTRLVLPADNSYGSLSANGSWSGMVPLLMEGQAQIAIGDFTINEPRRRVLDFTLPVYESSICVFIRGTQIRDIEWNNFVFPFSAELWISEMIAMVGLAVCLTVVRIVKLQEGKGRIAAAMISVNHVCAIFCQQGTVFSQLL